MAEYISLDTVITTTKNYGKGAIAEGAKTLDPVDDIVALAEAIEWLNITEAEPVRHRVWMPVYESEMTGWNPAFAGRDPIGGYICSGCKEEAVYDCNDKFVLSNYCPACGAKMDGGIENAAD